MKKNYHFIGIGGIGMSALARILREKGVDVSGSDVTRSSVVEQLQAAGAKIAIGHSKENVLPTSCIVYTTDISETNPELMQARAWGIPILHRSELLRDLMQGSQPLLVAGAHGKTTTSSLLAHVLLACQLEPSFAVGGMVKSLGSNGQYGRGRYFVAEADESDGSFLKYPGYGAILTNIDNDHLEFWKTQEALLKGFQTFATHIASKTHLFWCKDDPQLASLNIEGVSYGFTEGADLLIKKYNQKEWSTFFDCSFQGKDYLAVAIPMIGAYNVLNASAVFGLSLTLGISEEKIRQAFLSFEGVGRRVEKKGEHRGITFYDDYGHHPTEILATLKALKKAVEPRRLVLAFQPHRYTRTRDCMDQFAPVFEPADLVCLTDIYSAREAPIEGVTIQNLFKKVQEGTSKEVMYAPRAELASSLVNCLQPGDVLVTMGAGDITKVSQEVMDFLK